MKKLKNLSMLMLGTAMSVCTISCGSDSSDDSIADGGTALSTSDEKVYVESVLKEFAENFDVNEFNVLTSLGKELADLDMDADVLDDLIESLISSSSTTRANTYEDVKRTMILANLSGTYEASFRNPKWVRTSAGNSGQTYIVYTDMKGSKWEISLVSSGSYGKVLVDESEDWQYMGYYNKNYNYKISEIQSYLDVPQNVVTTLKKDGTTLVYENLSINRFSAPMGELNANCDCDYSVNSNVLSFNISSFGSYKAGQGSNVNATVSRNGKNLIKTNAEGVLYVSGEDVKDGNVIATVTILDKLQVKGNVASIKAAMDASDADYNSKDKSSVRNYVNLLNSCFSCKLYNSGAEQCTMLLDIDNNTYYGSSTVYYEPIMGLKFADGTSYSFDQYYTDNDFSALYKTVNSIIDDLEDLLD